MSIQQPPQPNIIMAPVAPFPPGMSAAYFSQSQRKAIKSVGVLQIILGSLIVIFGIADMSRQHKYSFNSFIGQNIWCGAFMIICGAFTLTSAIGNNHCRIFSSMILNVVCTLVTSVVVVLSAISVSISRPCRSSSYSRYSSYSSRNCEERSTFLALQGLTLLSGSIQMILAICISGLTCGVTCCRASSSNSLIQFSAGHPQAGQALAVYPGSSQQHMTPVYYPAPAPGIFRPGVGQLTQPDRPIQTANDIEPHTPDTGDSPPAFESLPNPGDLSLQQ